MEPKRFLTTFHEDFSTRADGRSWPRWKNSVKNAHLYAEALLSLPEGSRKNMHRLANSVDVPEDQLEQFVRDSPWDYEALQEHLANSVLDAIRTAEAGFIVDDFGIEKQGKHSVGTQRQYSGTLGKTGNCQVAVNVVYVAPGKERNADQATWPLGTRLYLPESWANDKHRRREAHVPGSVAFQPKWQIALTMLDAVRGLKHGFVGADADYGTNGEFRGQLRAWNEAYVLAVNPSSILITDAAATVIPPHGRTSHITLPEGTRVERVQDVFQRASWQWVEWSEGTKGVLGGWFYRERIRVASKQVHAESLRWATDEVSWLLLEKRKNERGDDEFKAYLCWGVDHDSLEGLVEKAHLRWAIEQFHREAKQLLGLDRFEGRTWPGWHHHASMVLVAYAFLSMLRIRRPEESLPTLGETARAVQLELATQGLIEDHGLKRPEARKYASSVLRKVSSWFKDRK
jgi:SRSO17 transposase